MVIRVRSVPMKTRTMLYLLGYGVVAYFVYKAVRRPAAPRLPSTTTSTVQNLAGTSEGKTSVTDTNPGPSKTTSPANRTLPSGATAIEYARRMRAMQLASPSAAHPSGATAIEYARRRIATPRDRRIAGVGYVR